VVLTALPPLRSLRPLLLLPVVVAILLIRRFSAVLVAVGFVTVVAALTALLLEARAALVEHTEIMIRELQIIFHLDAVAGKLGVPRHVLVFLEQLGCVTALAVVLTVGVGPAPDVLRPLAPTTAPAAALTIADQMSLPF
jgi:hypothetical protein